MRTFRYPVALLILGILFVILPIMFVCIPAANHLISGTPMSVQYGRDVSTTHVADRTEMLLYATAPLLISALGAFLIANWKAAVIQTTDSGIAQFGLLGRKIFESGWSDLTEVAQRPGARNGVYFVIRFKSGEMILPSGYNFDALAAEIHTHSPNLDLSPWGWTP